MSCTRPQCFVVPFNGGKPKPLMQDYEPGYYPKFGRVIYLPCGGCIACRRERRQELTLLQACEASLYEDNWFVTLTYDDWKTMQLTDFPPYSLSKKHLSDFNESMRKYCLYHGCNYRFFACGEYGERYGRPHYHLSVFGLSPKVLGLAVDNQLINIRKKGFAHGKFIRKIQQSLTDSNGNEYWRSSVIASRWPFGDHKIYRANRETFQYVAGYVTKKLTGKAGHDFRASGKISEFQAQSRPSIGRPWFDEYYKSISIPDKEQLVNDAVAIAGIEWKCPRIFDKWLRSYDHFDGPVVADHIKELRSAGLGLPDRKDLQRKAAYDLYAAERYFAENRSHKEIQ